MKNKAICLSISALLGMSGCSILPVSSDHKVPVSTEWKKLSNQNQIDAPLKHDEHAAIDHYWWNHFKDERLTKLINEALANNKTLKIAISRLAEAKAGRMEAQSLLKPQLNANVSSSRGNSGFATFDSTVIRNESTIQASWELDIFGANRARVAESQALIASQEASNQAVRISMLAEVARNYFEMRNNAYQLDVIQRNLALQRKTQAIVQARFNEKLASALDVERVNAQIATAEAELPKFSTAYDAALNRLNVLVGKAPGNLDETLSQHVALQPLNHQILIAAPANIIAERPDIKAAEKNFIASNFALQTAKADLFPKVSLTALFGAQTVTPASYTPWGIGIQLIQPLLNFGRIEAQIDAKDAQSQQKFLAYQQTVLEALENVENTLSAYLNETTRSASLQTALTSQNKAVSLSQEKYSVGLIGLIDVLNAQQEMLSIESTYYQSQYQLRINLVNVFAACGGGWKM